MGHHTQTLPNDNFMGFPHFQIARDGHLEELTTYLESSEFHEKHLDALDFKNNSALHYATRYSHFDIVKNLVQVWKL